MIKAIRFLPPLALMGLVYFLSDQPDLSTGLGFWDLILRKLAHMSAYGLLTLLWWRALAPLTRFSLPVAVGIAFLFAISDEYHQTFIEGRHGSPIDVGIDSIGIALAVIFVRGYRARRRSSAESGSTRRSQAIETGE